mgnify:CR=1 FL=1
MIVVKKEFIQETCKNIKYYFMSKKSFPFLFIKYDIKTSWTYSRLSKLYVRVGSKKITPKKNTHFLFFWGGAVCLRSIDPFHMVTYYMEWVTTPWTHGTSRFKSTEQKI